MDANYLTSAYAPLLIQFLLAMGLAAILIGLSALVGRHKFSRAKMAPYECGIEPTGNAREAFPVHFYLVGMIFILFDIEAIFLYPWALIYRELHSFGFIEMVLYIFILLAGYIYLWKKGALDWNR
jgi:NADH-quinone oxidoreductase subunit A